MLRNSESGLLLKCKSRLKRRMSKSSLKWGRRLLIAALFLLVLQLSKIIWYKTWKSDTDSDAVKGDVPTTHDGRRRLLSQPATNESDEGHGAVWERCDFEKAHSPYAWLPLYIFLIFLLFVAIAIICDDFFVPSLEAISEKLDLSEDVAGATFMAAGSSAPELFTSVAGVGVESDVGVGTIVGSAMFNILIIVALSGMLAGKTLHLDWRPLFRDAFVYGVSVAFLIGFSWDAKLEWWEALILLLMYILYIVIMKFNRYLMKLLAKIECFWCKNDSRIEPVEEQKSETDGSGNNDVEAQPAEHQSSSHSVHEEHKHRFVHSHRGELAGSFANRRRSTCHGIEGHRSHTSGQTGTSDHKHHFAFPHIEPAAHGHHNHHEHHHHKNSKEELKEVDSNASIVPSKHSNTSGEEEEEEEEAVLVLIPFLPPIRSTPPDTQLARKEGKIGWVKYILKMILFIISFPFMVAFTWTIPNCSENRKWYMVTFSFTMSIVWIAVISFLMVTIVARTGCILDIDQFTMGLVVIAVGTSVPDCLSSILVARDGFGDMAISNAIGSNVFDVNLGLGLPFLISIAIQKGSAFFLLSDSQMEEFYDGEFAISPHSKFGFLLLFILFMALFTFVVFRFRLTRWTGLCFIVFYLLFLIYSFMQELLPACHEGKNC